jgi:BlaI family penicillinase repressor
MSIPQIGESEWYVLKALWEKAPMSGNDIVKAVSAHTDWSSSTILTMLRRLVKKKAVGVEQQSVMMYVPLLSEHDVVRLETDLFLKRVYKGSVNLLVKGFLENGSLSEQEIDELKKLIGNQRDGDAR